MNRDAEREWDEAVRGVNFMTPERIDIGYTSDGDIYELSQGRGFDRNQMFAVSILVDGNIDTDRSTLFNEGSFNQRATQAQAFVAQLTGGTT